MRRISLLVGASVTSLLVLTASPAMAAGVQNGRIAYDHADPANPDDTSVYTARPNGTHAKLLVAHTCCAGWSPDGTKVAVPRLTTDGRIGTAVVNADGTDYKPLPIRDRTLQMGCTTGAWAPGGRWLYCETWDDTNPARNGIYRVRASDGSHRHRITANPVGGHDIPGSFSPDGKSLVFNRFDQDGNTIGLFTVRRNGTHLHQITPTGVSLNIGADWSPRHEIVYSEHVTPDARGSIWVVHPDGTGAHQLNIIGLPCGGLVADPTSIGCHAPRWSPDGRKLIFASNSATSVDIYTCDADGRHVHQVTHDGTDDNPDWGSRPALG
jgi:hypothetical protein